ncbi:MAG: hypothetical protein ACSLE0_11160 [Chitinophagaceae bacterium]
MKELLYTLFFFATILSCKERYHNNRSYCVRTDIRFGSRFCSIFINEDGTAYAIKGRGSHYTEPLKIISSDTSNIFKLDSIKLYLENLNKIKDEPVIGGYRNDAHRAEIYCNQKKVYDAYNWDEEFWKLIKPIMEQIPKGFNPFRDESENPFK